MIFAVDKEISSGRSRVTSVLHILIYGLEIKAFHAKPLKRHWGGFQTQLPSVERIQLHQLVSYYGGLEL